MGDFRYYGGRRGRRNGWAVVAVIFMGVSVVLAVVALYTSRPLSCDHIQRYEDGSRVCEIVLERNQD